MLGLTGASGAPYAARVLRALVASGADVGVVVSRAGAQVIALELYGDRELNPDGAVERFVTDHGDAEVRIWGESDYSAPYASGSSRTDAVIVCPCSMATVGTIAGGAEANLIHRAAAVQLKEGRKLVLVPRETPLSDIHLENLLRIKRAGASVVPAMPGFYHLPQTDRRPRRLRRRPRPRLRRHRGDPLRTVGVVTLQPDQVREMFDRISPAYDRMNRVMSAGMDGLWRARAVRSAGLGPGSSAIDVCCGTGDLAIALLDAVSTRGRVVGVDFSERMIEAARAKSSQVEWLRGDALDLPFAGGEFDAATVGFGVRNLPDIERGFREMARVVRAGGRVVCLELTEPPRLVAPFARLWTDRAVPLLGRLIARETDAYRYLPASVHRFPPAAELAAIMRAAGLERVQYRRLTGGAVALHVGTVPA